MSARPSDLGRSIRNTVAGGFLLGRATGTGNGAAQAIPAYLVATMLHQTGVIPSRAQAIPPTAAGLSGALDNVFGSTRGSLLFRGATAWQVLLPGTAGALLKTGGAGADPAWAASAAPQVTSLTSGTGTYTTPAGALYLVVELVGGGGGGGGSGSSGATNGATGGNSTFSTLTGNGGVGGNASGNTAAAAGGTATGGDINVGGASGGEGMALALANELGGTGGSSFYGGSGPGGSRDSTVGASASVNSGSGGGGAVGGAGFSSGTGGGAGGYVRKLISSPAASYAYAVGAAGTGGTGGTGGAGGGTGGAGRITVTAYFN